MVTSAPMESQAETLLVMLGEEIVWPVVAVEAAALILVGRQADRDQTEPEALVAAAETAALCPPYMAAVAVDGAAGPMRQTRHLQGAAALHPSCKCGTSLNP